MLKKLTALLLIMTMLALCAVPAFADSDIPADGYVPKREWRLNHGRGAYYLTQPGETIESENEKTTTRYKGTFSGDKLKEVEYSGKYQALNPETGKKVNGSFSFRVTPDGTVLEYTYTENGKTNTITYDGKTWKDKEGKEWDLSGWGKGILAGYEPEFKWYNNTVCLLGLPIRDLKPGLTDKWYTIVPVDLTKDAVYIYPMIAGSLYYVGECQVTVKDGQVTTDFSLPEGLCYDKRHCLQWFTSLDDITPEFLNNLNASYTFGQPVSIADDLKGQDVAILFICNQLQYHIPFSYNGKGFATRYLSREDFVKNAQAEMTALLARIQQ